MGDCKNYVSEEDIKALKESELHIEHVARSRNLVGEKVLSVTDTIRGEKVINRTLDGLEELYQSALSNIGYQQMGDYKPGITIDGRNQIVFENGSWYIYRGDLPHVTTGATLAEDGGIWSEENPNGLWVMIDLSQQKCKSIKELLTVGVTGNVVFVQSYHDGLNKGSGMFYFDKNIPSEKHDGGFYIYKNKSFPDWNVKSEVEEWFKSSSGGKGCWVRLDNEVTVCKYGAKGDFDGQNGTDDTMSFNASTSGHIRYNDSDFSNISSLKKTIIVDDTTHAYLITGSVYVRKGQELKGRGLGPARIYIKVDKNNPEGIFLLGLGLVDDPFPDLKIESINESDNSLILNGSIKIKDFAWLYANRKVFFNGLVKIIKSTEEIGGKSKLNLNNVSGLNLGMKITKAELVDSGGLPPSISNLCTEGGPVGVSENNYPVIDGRSAAGMSINTLFITAAPLGIWGASGDVNIHTCTIDNGGEGIRLQGSRNSIVGCHFFWNNVAVNIKESSFDWVFSGCTFAFSKNQDISVNGLNKDDILNINFTGCNFLENAKYSKSAMIHLVTGNAELSFTGCNFRNMWGYVFIQSSQEKSKISFNSCLFDGSRSNNKYIQSTESKGLLFGSGDHKVQSCSFKNISNYPVTINNTSTSNFLIDNNDFHNVNSKSIINIIAVSGKLKVTNNIDFNNDKVLFNGIIKYGNVSDIYEINNKVYNIKNNIIEMSIVVGKSKQLCINYNSSPTSSVYYMRSNIFNVITGTANITSVKDYIVTESVVKALPGNIPPVDTLKFLFDNGLDTKDFNKDNKLQVVHMTLPSGSVNIDLN